MGFPGGSTTALASPTASAAFSGKKKRFSAPSVDHSGTTAAAALAFFAHPIPAKPPAGRPPST